MIRIVTLAEIPMEVLEHVSRRLHAAFGLGCEVEGEAELPETAWAAGRDSLDAPRLLADVDDETELYADDKLVFLTVEPLSAPPGPMGKGPVDGFASATSGRCVVSLAALGGKGQLPLDVGAAKRTAHYVGHLWDLHHCFDPRCAMQPGWAPSFLQHPEVALCLFCREKSERKIKLGQA
jgi:predicted Zn-dependent protease